MYNVEFGRGYEGRTTEGEGAGLLRALAMTGDVGMFLIYNKKG